MTLRPILVMPQMRKRSSTSVRPTASLARPLRFPMVSLSLTIQTKNMIRPTSIPYAVRKEHVRIPLETGNPELDFINELYATALRSGISPYSLQIENGQFVIPHGDHNHYIKGTFSRTSRLLSPPSSNHPISLQKGDLDKKQ